MVRNDLWLMHEIEENIRQLRFLLQDQLIEEASSAGRACLMSMRIF